MTARLIRRLFPRWYWKRRMANHARKRTAPGRMASRPVRRPTWADLRAADAWHRVEILNGNR